MSARREGVAFGAAIALAMVALAPGCGSDNGVVGGDCATGFTPCDLQCVDLQTDTGNCGACGHACSAGTACVAGVCGGPGAGDATTDGSQDGSTLPDGAGVLGDGSDCDANDPAHFSCGSADGGDEGGSEDGGGSEGGLSDGPFSDGCVPPFDSRTSCGACGLACTLPNDKCDLVDGGYACVSSCSAPSVDCNGTCIDVHSDDPHNCGGCGLSCASGYCLLGTCQGAVAGNVMVIGHDFKKTGASEQQAKLLTNSVFRNPVTAVRLLSFEHYADAAAVTNGRAILTGYASARGIALTITASTDDAIVTSGGVTATNEDVLLVWDQPSAPAGKLGALGSAWAAKLSQFTQGGGIVIVLDGGRGIGEMPAFETNAALLAVTSHAQVAAQSPIDVPAAGLSIAIGMTSVYLADVDSESFATSEPASGTLIYVSNVRGQPSALVAVHRIVH